MVKKGIFSSIPAFFGEVKEETGKVSWPPRKDVIKYTLIVVEASVAVAAFLGGLDYVLRFVIF